VGYYQIDFVTDVLYFPHTRQLFKGNTVNAIFLISHPNSKIFSIKSNFEIVSIQKKFNFQFAAIETSAGKEKARKRKAMMFFF